MSLSSLFRAISDCLCGPSEPQGPPGAPPHPLEDNLYVPPQVPHKPTAQQYQPAHPIVQPQPVAGQQYATEYPPLAASPQYRPSPPTSPPPSHRPHHYTSPPTSPPPVHRPAHRHENLNQQNQQNEYYQTLRSRANNEGAQMAQCFEESHAAYARGDGALAKELSNKGKAHQKEMERLNAQASEWIFSENNKDSKPGEIDLHGLYVKEAITFTERAIQDARQRGESQINLIVGKGLHSPKGVAKLKPAIEELMQKQGLIAELDENNGGVLTVNLNGQASGKGNVLNPEDITRRLERKDDGCILM